MQDDIPQQSLISLSKLDEMFVKVIAKKGISINDINAKRDEVRKIMIEKAMNSDQALRDFVTFVRAFTEINITLDQLLAIMMLKEITQIINFDDDVDDSIVDYLCWRRLYITRTGATSSYEFDVY